MCTSATTSQSGSRSRLPDTRQFIPELAENGRSTRNATANREIPQTTINLVQLRAGQITGSTHHTLRSTGVLRQAGETEERIAAVASWRDAPYFTDAERVALELVEHVLTANMFGEPVDDELYARATAYYDGKALWKLTVAIGQMCFFLPGALFG